MLGFGLTLVPQCSYNSLSSLLPFVISSVFEDAGVPLDNEKLINALPSPQTLRHVITETAVDTVLLTQQSLQTNPCVYLSCDKGNKQGNKNLAKVISWYDKKKSTYIFDGCRPDGQEYKRCRQSSLALS